jgi:SAM-dependent methyltransferase
VATGASVGEGDRLTARWDDEYRSGRYADEPPLPFVTTIRSTLDAHPGAREGRGLYVGCGNGRNYLPLLDASLNMYGIDVSFEAVRQLRARRPAQASRLLCADFRHLRDGTAAFGYLIAIQVFQHGGDATVSGYFDKVRGLLRRGGLFFLRVNSTSTDVYHRHTVVEENRFGGFTVRYDDGPKRGLLVHFASRAELLERTIGTFRLVREPREDVARRVSPKTGSWAQWEIVWQKLS